MKTETPRSGRRWWLANEAPLTPSAAGGGLSVVAAEPGMLMVVGPPMKPAQIWRIIEDEGDWLGAELVAIAADVTTAEQLIPKKYRVERWGFIGYWKKPE